MATLDLEVQKKRKRRQVIFSITVFISATICNSYLVAIVKVLIKNRFNFKSFIRPTYIESIQGILQDEIQLKTFLVFEGFILLYIFYVLTRSMNKISESKTMIVAGRIEIPKPVGNGQQGTSRFLTEKEIEQIFSFVDEKKIETVNDRNLGLVVGKTKNYKKIICIEDDINTILIGSTRSGKTRREILETIWLKGKTNNSMVITDPKGELFLYSNEYLKSCGFDLYVFDLRYINKSMQYNYLQYVSNAAMEGDIAKATDYAWDIVSSLVGTPKGEPLWTNGEASVITASILSVVYESSTEFHNLTNVYFFIAYMCKEDTNGELPITKFFEELEDDHPAKAVFATAEISPEKMRGSFFGSALTTLRLFANQNIADLASRSDFDLKDIGRKKSALFLCIPDEKKTFYPLVTLFLSQAYVCLVELATEYGNRLPVNVDFIIEEAGNFPTIPDFGGMTSVGAGRGIRFTIVLQDFQQLEKYYKEDHKNIKGNCWVTIYLKTPTPDTLDELSKRVGNYTVQTNNESTSVSSKKGSGTNFSSSASMQKRPLLYPEEIGRIEAPYSLVLFSGKFPAIIESPDLLFYQANNDFGMGTKKENEKLLIEREAKREERRVSKVKLWGIWNEYKKDVSSTVQVSNEEKFSFLNNEDDYESLM